MIIDPKTNSMNYERCPNCNKSLNGNSIKVILTLLFFSLVTLSSFAQENIISSNGTVTDSISRLVIELEKRGHFTFKDIPINGSLNQFVAQLKKQGFTVMKTTDLDAILSGKFTGEDVYIFVQATTKTVYGVTVMYNKQTSWKSIKSQYENMKSMLTAKYGEPREIIEKFDASHSDYENLGLELYALSEDKCTYMTHFATETGNGMIRLRISPDASLVINYVDTVNYLLVSSKAYNDL